MSQIEDKTKKVTVFTCPNAYCGKVITKSLKALNLQQDSEEPYDACPYCLTEINLDVASPIIRDEPETFEHEETEAEFEEAEPAKMQVEIPETPSECLHHVGYLSEKSPKEQIPDECMMCKDIVKCMLKKMNE